MTAERTDIVIIGGGMAGLSCAYSLRDHDLRVTLLEERDLSNGVGSSGGLSRMYREMYSNPYLCTMSQHANQLWRDVESRHGVELRRQHGLLFYGEPFDEETIEGSIPGAKRVMDAQGIPYEELSALDIRERFPLLPRPDDHVGLFEPTAGAILSDRALRTFSDHLGRNTEIRRQTRVQRIDLEGPTVQVETNRGRFECEQVVLAAGPWTNDFLEPLGLKLPLEIWPILWGHYSVHAEFEADFPQWFFFQRAVGNDGGLYYGFPAMDRHSDGQARIKVGIDWCPPEDRSASMHTLKAAPSPELVELLDRFLMNQLTGVKARLEVRTSPYTMTPDVNFILDRLHPRLSVFTGGSGQAFKFCPLIGSLLAATACNETIEVELGPWRANRFTS